MRIFGQTWKWRRYACNAGAIVAIVALEAVSCASGRATAQAGQVRCVLTANQAPARGTIVVKRDGRESAAGSCASPISVPAGKWRATVRLDGALDNPSKEVDVLVSEGKTATVAVDFQTGVLEVRVEAKGGSGTGMVTVNRGTKRIGTLGAGVAAQLSAGKYQVVVQYSGKERRYNIDLRPGQRRLVRAEF